MICEVAVIETPISSGWSRDDRREEAFAEQPDVRILLLVADDLHQVFGRVNGIRAELIVDDREPGREIDCGQHFEPLVDQKEAFPVGFHVVEALAAKRLLRQLNAIDQIGKPVERFGDSRQMLGTAWARFHRFAPVQACAFCRAILDIAPAP